MSPSSDKAQPASSHAATASSPQRIALSLLAHPDDAEILCAGTLIRLAQAGWKIHIATMTPGDCGSTTEDRWQIAARRIAENRASAALIDADYHCLDERDAFICHDKPTIAKTFALFRTINPSLVFTHAPRDYMVDHEITSLLVRSASFLYAAPNVSDTPLPPGAAVPHLYYCDPIEGLDPLGNLVVPTTLIDISQSIDLKSKMLACHASQRDWLRAHHGMDEYIDAMKRFSAQRGQLAKTPFAEGFIQHRGHAYPHDDLLKKLLS